MAKRIVVMATIPGKVVRGKTVRSNVDYSRYSQATWRWWCHRNGASFVLLEKPLGGARCRHLPPTIQRWLAAEEFANEFGPEVEIAMVDADTMIRWDAPSLFDEARGQLCAVRDGEVRWINGSIKAFASLFPGVCLHWWDYFNCGVVVMTGRHAALMKGFVEFVLERWKALSRIMRASDVGTDQTLLNYFVRLTGERVQYLPAAFNMLHCVNVSPFEAVLAASSEEELIRVFSSDWLYDFIDLAYVWHFTNVPGTRKHVMSQTWSRIRACYAGSRDL